MVTIKIDLDKKCIRCGKGGALPSGLCMACVARGIQEGKFDHIIKKARENMLNKNPKKPLKESDNG